MSAQDTLKDREAAQILRDNDRGGYTVPTKGLYPFQWNWDSCLVALGWAELDLNRAFTEIETLFSGQWPDGMVPHIVFHRPDPGYFPGPERWGTGRRPATSGITQPPVAASCVRRLVERARDAALAERRARALLPKLLAWHRWFHTVRDPDATGIVTTLHPWETGMDNSPAWDEALAQVEVAPNLEAYVRKDTTHVDPGMRPTAAEYDRYMTLVQLYREHGWRHEITRLSPFRIGDVATNCILLRADRDLLALAERFGEAEATEQLREWIARSEGAFARFVEPTSGIWRSFDQVAGQPVPAATSAGFLAFWAGLGDDALARQLEAWIAKAPHAVASTAPDDPRFDRKRYWRGPIWAVVNFMIAEGAREAGRTELAERIRTDTRRLIEAAGFYEYFDPIDGAGAGGAHFTWTAAMWLAWAGRLTPPASAPA
jgi:alpha,alpha-trehalase